ARRPYCRQEPPVQPADLRPLVHWPRAYHAEMVASHVIAFDDAPFARDWRGDVAVAGVAFAGDRLEDVVRGRVRRDGADATAELARLVAQSRSAAHLQLIMLEGIALAG